MENKNHIVSVSDNLKEKASKILNNYKKLWLQLLLADKYETIDWGINIVKALNEAYKNYGGFEKYFISEWFMFDFVSAFEKEKWFSQFIGSDSIPYECKPQCLFNSTMIGEYIYGGIPSEFPLADIAKRNCLTEEEGQKIYNEFWQKAIEVLNGDDNK